MDKSIGDESPGPEKNRWAVLGLALLAGAGFTSLLPLLLNLNSPVLALFVSLLLSPGGILIGLKSPSAEFYSPAALLTINACLYTVLIFVLLSLRPSVRVSRLRAAALIMAVLAICAMAASPRFDPLWPVGMDELAGQEKVLRGSLVTGMTMDDARRVLQSRNIKFNEQPMQNLIFTRIPTAAGQFPCGYDLYLSLSFGHDGKLSRADIGRVRVCP